MVPLETLKNVRFLHDIGDDHLQWLASLAEVQEVPANAVVFRQGQASPSIYLVVEGNVSLELDLPGRGRVRFQTAGPGELLGWSSLLETGPMIATARTLTPTRLLILNTAQVQALCAHNSEFGHEFVRRTARALAQRLATTRLQLLDVYRDLLPLVPDEGGPA